MGTRLGRPYPKPLTTLRDGRSILQQQFDNLAVGFPGRNVSVVVGFKKELVMEALPDALFLYNPDFDQTNTSKSLLRALRHAGESGVLWLNGDVVFEPELLEALKPYIAEGQSAVCVNTESVGEEEVKYTVDGDGFVAELSKTVQGGLGEAVGINYVSGRDLPAVRRQLEECDPQDYFERGIERAVAEDGVRVRPVDISRWACMEIDFQADLDRANNTF
ncbi:MAG: phosphocholine cytidylyltransferase family protein [Actinomycetota bacterium]|nr:phosphocholine cytidylyltransferase family protein [Actinomycetota bacterium]